MANTEKELYCQKHFQFLQASHGLDTSFNINCSFLGVLVPFLFSIRKDNREIEGRLEKSLDRIDVELKSEISAIKNEFRSEISSLKTEVYEVRACVIRIEASLRTFGFT